MTKTVIKMILLSMLVTFGLMSCAKKYSLEIGNQFLETLDTGTMRQAFDFYRENQDQIDPDQVDELGQSALHCLVLQAVRVEKNLERSQSMVDIFVDMDKERLDQINTKSLINQVKHYQSRMDGIRTIIEFLITSPEYLEPPQYLLTMTNLTSPKGSKTEVLFDGLSYRDQLQLMFYFFHPQRVDLLNDHLQAYDKFSLCEQLMARLILDQADREYKNSDGLTALALAEQLGLEKTAAILQSDKTELIKILAHHHIIIETVLFEAQDDESYKYNGRDHVIVIDYGVPQARKLREDIAIEMIKAGLIDEVVFKNVQATPAEELKILIGENIDVKYFQKVLKKVSDLGLPIRFKLLQGAKYDGYIEIQSMAKEETKAYTKAQLQPFFKKNLSHKKLMTLLQ